MPLDNPHELFYWVDSNDNVLGSITRAEAHSQKTKIHRAVDILITNNNFQVLLQKRSMNKDKYAGYWSTSASGHVTFNGSYEEAAARELKEEIGLSVPLQYHSSFLLQMPTETEITALYVGTAPESAMFLVDPTEVDQVKWVKINDLSSFARHHKFTLGALRAFRVVGYLKE